MIIFISISRNYTPIYPGIEIDFQTFLTFGWNETEDPEVIKGKKPGTERRGKIQRTKWKKEISKNEGRLVDKSPWRRRLTAADVSFELVGYETGH